MPDDLAAFKGTRAEYEAINYYETPFTEAEIRLLLNKLGLSAGEILRKDEPVAKRLNIERRDLSDEELIGLMAKHPDLI
jgi:arsenate reductase